MKPSIYIPLGNFSRADFPLSVRESVNFIVCSPFGSSDISGIADMLYSSLDKTLGDCAM